MAVQTLIIQTDSPCLSMRLGRGFAPPADVREFGRTLDEYFHAELTGAPQNDWLEARLP